MFIRSLPRSRSRLCELIKETIEVPLKQVWKLEVSQLEEVTKEWYSSDEEDSYEISLAHLVTNQGPSQAPKDAKIFVYLNKNNIGDFGIVEYKNVSISRG